MIKTYIIHMYYLVLYYIYVFTNKLFKIKLFKKVIDLIIWKYGKEIYLYVGLELL